ncbi:MAG: hypothetical protein ABFD83_07130 [Armatimonadota bacterium]
MVRYCYEDSRIRTWGLYLLIAFMAGIAGYGYGASFMVSAFASLVAFVIAFRVDNSRLSRWPAAIEVDGNEVSLFRALKYRVISLDDVLRMEKHPGHPFFSNRKVPWAEITICTNDRNEVFCIESYLEGYEELIAILSVAADNWQPHEHSNESQ